MYKMCSGVGAVGAVGARATQLFKCGGSAPPPTLNLHVKLFYTLLREVRT